MAQPVADITFSEFLITCVFSLNVLSILCLISSLSEKQINEIKVQECAFVSATLRGRV